MGISSDQRRLLSRIELDASRSGEQLAQDLGMNPSTVRRHLRLLGEMGLISPRRPFISMSALGYTQYTFYFSLASEEEEHKSELMDRLLRAPEVIWILELGGDFQYGLSFCVRDINAIVKRLRGVSARFGGMFFEKSFAVRLSFTLIGRGYLDPGADPSLPLSYQSTDSRITVDELDEKILSAMANEQCSSFREVARLVGAPVATVERRRKSLEDRGAITGYFHRVQATRLGMHQYKLLVYSTGIDLRLRNDLLAFCQASQRVVYFVECMGSWDYEMGVEVATPKEVSYLVRDIYDRFGRKLRTVKAVPIFDYLKFGSYPGLLGSVS